MKPLKIFGVYEEGRSIFTKNKTPGKKVYDEKLMKIKGEEFREWNPRKSKIGAYIKTGVNGMIFGVDPAYRTMIDLIHLCNDRKNIAPIMADAFQTATFEHLVPTVDVVVQDVAQRNQQPAGQSVSALADDSRSERNNGRRGHRA